MSSKGSDESAIGIVSPDHSSQNKHLNGDLCAIYVRCVGCGESKHLYRLHSTKISCTGSNGYMSAIQYVSYEVCNETTAKVCYYQCDASMLQKMLTVRCIKIPQ